MVRRRAPGETVDVLTLGESPGGGTPTAWRPSGAFARASTIRRS